jgi:TetR/AcrR family transcriptional regulator, cholesterol catabolism regulator
MALDSEREPGDARQRVLDVAELLFMQQGYAAITLRDIAETLGMRQASLYYHFPDGKEQLYVAVVQRVFARHRAGMEEAIAQGDGTLASQLAALARWFTSQPPLNLLGMTHADFSALSAANREALSYAGYDALFAPLRQMFAVAQARNEIRPVQPDLLAGCFLALIDSAGVIRRQPTIPAREQMVDEMIALLLEGLYPRPESFPRDPLELSFALFENRSYLNE